MTMLLSLVNQFYPNRVDLILSSSGKGVQLIFTLFIDFGHSTIGQGPASCVFNKRGNYFKERR